jgi:hypothetical protein
LLFLVWANLHGGWLVGLGVLGVWTIFTVAVNPRDARPWLTTAALCGLATLCTPYGWTLWIFLWQTVGVTRDITEWRPLWTVPPIAWLPWLAAIGITLWAIRQTDRDRWARSAIVLLLAYFSLRVERVLPFLVGAAVLFAAPLVARAVDSRRRRGASTLRIRWRADQPPLKLRRSAEASATSEARRLRPSNGSRPRHEVAVALFVAITMTVTGLWISYSSQRCIPVRGPWVADREAARFLVEGTGPGKLVVPFDWGEYAIWHMGPRLRVSMDGRRETVYSDKRLAEHDAILAGTALGLSTLEAWQPEYVWLPHESSNTRQWLEAHGYRLPVSTARSFIGVRGDVPDLRALTATAGEARRCFPH